MSLKFFCALSSLALLGSSVTSAYAQDASAPQIGAPAPAFTATDINETAVSLESFKGKYVVLEWFNYGCPYVRKHYRSNDMQALQKEFMAKDVAWIAINSTEPKHTDYKDTEATKELLEKLAVSVSHFVLDETGVVGKAYAAKTTPHMFIINPEGTLIYQGAIDDNDEADADPKEATNFVRDGLVAALGGEQIVESDTKPYGCSIKYPE